MKFVKAALAAPHAVLVMIISIVILGVTAATRIPADLLPIFETPAVQIITFYPGMPTEVVEKDITTQLESWTGQSNGIAGQESKSLIAVSIVKDYFRPDIESQHRHVSGHFTGHVRPLLPSSRHHFPHGHALRPDGRYSSGAADGEQPGNE